jgi:hypothetical protein
MSKPSSQEEITETRVSAAGLRTDQISSSEQLDFQKRTTKLRSRDQQVRWLVLFGAAARIQPDGGSPVSDLLRTEATAATTINLRLAAVRCVAYEAADSGLLSQEAAASIRRVKGVRRIGVRTGNWLSTEEGKRLLQAAQVNTLARKARLRYVGVVDRLRLKAAVSCSDWTATRYRFEKSIGWLRIWWERLDIFRTVPIPGWVKAAVDKMAGGKWDKRRMRFPRYQ